MGRVEKVEKANTDDAAKVAVNTASAVKGEKGAVKAAEARKVAKGGVEENTGPEDDGRLDDDPFLDDFCVHSGAGNAKRLPELRKSIKCSQHLPPKG